jgi:hypothetical protein
MNIFLQKVHVENFPQHFEKNIRCQFFLDCFCFIAFSGVFQRWEFKNTKKNVLQNNSCRKVYPKSSRGLLKKKNTKKRIRRKATDRLLLLFCFLGAPFKRYARRLWTCHRRLAPAAGCGVFLYELVPSGDPFICCLCETFFFFLFNGFFYFLRKIN